MGNSGRQQHHSIIVGYLLNLQKTSKMLAIMGLVVLSVVGPGMAARIPGGLQIQQNSENTQQDVLSSPLYAAPQQVDEWNFERLSDQQAEPKYRAKRWGWFSDAVNAVNDHVIQPVNRAVVKPVVRTVVDVTGKAVAGNV